MFRRTVLPLSSGFNHTTQHNNLQLLSEAPSTGGSLCLQVEGKLSLCFNWAPLHEDVLGERRYSSTHYLTSALDGGEWSASRPGRFTPKERATGMHLMGGWVVPKAGLDAVEKRKIPSLLRYSKPRTPIVQSVAQRYTGWCITALWLQVETDALNIF
jgi:hypothetical protein